MAKFRKLKISDVREETKDAKSIAFEVPAELKEEFIYKEGQYLTLRLTVNGEEVRRSYSICSSPLDDELRIAVKKVEDGRASRYINTNFEKGSEVEVLKPMGNFGNLNDEENCPHFVGFAGGSGITPLMSILKTILRKNINSSFSLFYGNRNSNSIIFKEELEKLKEKYGERLKVYHILSREDTGNELTNGRIDGERALKLIAQYGDFSDGTHYFLCGPGGMIQSVSKALESKNIDKKNIHFELFNTDAPDEDEAAKEKKVGNAPSDLVAEITVVLDGEETTFELPQDGQVIVDAAIEQGLDAPFSCHGGVCMTCRARVVEGKVEMEQNYALSDEEVEQGFCLTCQSHPVTDKVIIDYDDIY